MSRTKGEAIRIGRQTVEITRPDKVLFSHDGITKGDLVDYYKRIAPAMLPYLRGRAIAMQRYPDGIAEQGFFQKKAAPFYPGWITTAELAKQNGSVRYVSRPLPGGGASLPASVAAGQYRILRGCLL